MATVNLKWVRLSACAWEPPNADAGGESHSILESANPMWRALTIPHWFVLGQCHGIVMGWTNWEEDLAYRFTLALMGKTIYSLSKIFQTSSVVRIPAHYFLEYVNFIYSYWIQASMIQIITYWLRHRKHPHIFHTTLFTSQSHWLPLWDGQLSLREIRNC